MKRETGTEITYGDIMRLLEKAMKAHALGRVACVEFSGQSGGYFLVTVHGAYKDKGWEFCRIFSSLDSKRKEQFAECEEWLDNLIGGNPSTGSNLAEG